MANMIMKNELRSISLTSRTHPRTSGIEEALNKVKAISTTSTGSSEPILMGLTGLEELYDCTEEFLKMGSTQRVMSCNGSEFMEEMLDGSLRLMDICNVSRDLMVETHEHLLGVQSCLRRAGGGRDQLDVAISGYAGIRKNMRKEAKKLLGSLKKFDGESCSSSSSVKNGEQDAVIETMRQVVSVSVLVLKSFLEFLSGRKSNIKSKLASILKNNKKDQHDSTKSELEALDSAICGVFCAQYDIQKKLEEVEMCIDGFEKNLEGLFRRLIRTRASLLNIVSN